MRSSPNLAFTGEAEDDLRSILSYTLLTWGEEQRDVYANRIMAGIHDLVSHPELGSGRDDIAPGIRIRRIGQHVVFYRVLERSILIIRILHRKMDPATHLKEFS
jgi:toxin ParE1/3/4